MKHARPRCAGRIGRRTISTSGASLPACLSPPRSSPRGNLSGTPKCSNNRKSPNAGNSKSYEKNSNAKNIGKSENGKGRFLFRLPHRLPSVAINPALVEAAASSRSAAGRDASPPLPGLFHLGSHYCRNCPDSKTHLHGSHDLKM